MCIAFLLNFDSTTQIDRDLLLVLDPNSNNMVNPSSFHHDPDPQEISRSTQVLEMLFQRARKILDEFPGNEILTQICQLCANIAEFRADASVGKMLSAIQLLLLKAQVYQIDDLGDPLSHLGMDAICC